MAININFNSFIEYINSNYTNYLEDQKSIIEYYFYLNSVIVSRCNKK